MLNVKKNRLDYSELLAPPCTYELSKAIGTTYSLDLYALLAIPIALFYAKSMDGTFQGNRYDVLDAIQKSEEKIDLFCQRGKISVPENYNDLLAFMEGAIIEVQPPHALCSFHPKIWVLRFEKEGEVLYRLAVLSRNLTFDRSWDIACFTEGKPSGKENLESKKLSDYLRFFYENTDRPKDSKLLKELSTVVFEQPDFFNSIELYPILGFKQQLDKFPNPILDTRYEEMLVISPFLDKKILKRFSKVNKRVFLVSRKEELDKINANVLNDFEAVFCLHPWVVEGEHGIDTEGMEPLSQNLHAKIFIGTTGKLSDWYLGSANCSDPAFTRNAEFMLRLHSNRTEATVKSIRNNLLGEGQHLFEKYVPNTEEQEEVSGDAIEAKLRKIYFHLTAAVFKGRAIESQKNKNYDVEIEAFIKDLLYPDFSVKVSLIHRKEEQKTFVFEEVNNIVFENVALTKLSKFLVLHVFYKNERQSSLLVKVAITLPEERNDVVFNNLIDNKDVFFKYLQFMLSPSQFNSALEILNYSAAQKLGEELKKTDALGFIASSSIYEHLMVAASRSPQKLKEIDKIIERLKKNNIKVVEDFLPIWNVFKEFADE